MTNKFTLKAYLIHLDEVIVTLNEAKKLLWPESIEIKMSYMKVNSSYKDQNINLKK